MKTPSVPSRSKARTTRRLCGTASGKVPAMRELLSIKEPDPQPVMRIVEEDEGLRAIRTALDCIRPALLMSISHSGCLHRFIPLPRRARGLKRTTANGRTRPVKNMS